VRPTAGLTALVVIAAGCMPPTAAAPRFPDDVAAAVVAHDMRRLETDTLIVYYPAARRQLALRTAARIASCQRLARSRAQIDSWASREKPVIVMPEVPFNNALVLPRAEGYEQIAVVPTGDTLDLTTSYGLVPDPGWTGCHEVVHAVQEGQIDGFWGNIDRLNGAVLSPQAGLDPWFWEGLATYYEDELGSGPGRMRWPVWRGLFEAAYAGGGLDGDDLSEYKRAAFPGHHYLVGSHFIAWLVHTYGEWRLWRLIALQGRSFWVMAGVNSRFAAAFGKPLYRLIDEFDAELARSVPRRPVPPGERRLRAVGSDARYARAPDGSEAVVANGLDVPTHLEIRGPDGAVRWRVNLVDLVVPRRQVIASPALVSGMSFTADARTLYLTVIDLGATYQTTRLLRVDVAGHDIEVVASGLGPGGAVSPDGSRYWVAAPDGDAWGLAEVDLATRARRVVIPPRPGHYLLRVAPSPRGDRLAISRWNGWRFEIAVVSTATWADLQVIAGDGDTPIYDASWADDSRLLYLATVDGRFQIHLHDLLTGARTAISDAPYVALEPRAAAGSVRFLDRERWRWELAEIALPPAPPPPPVDLPEPPSLDGPADPPAPPAPAAAADPPATPDPAAAGPPSQTAPAAGPAKILGDTAYSRFDHFFRPQLHDLLALTGPGILAFGLGLAGGDRLGLQRWALAGYTDITRSPALYSVAGGYRNAMLAPWALTIEASNLRWYQLEDPNTPESRYVAHHRRDLVASFGRVVRATTSIGLRGIYAADDDAESLVRRRLGGPGVALDHDSFEATRFGGVRRHLGLHLAGAFFPDRWSTLDTDLIDTRAELQVTLPVPATHRHAITLTARHRRVTPRDPAPGFVPLEVGGAGPFGLLYQRRDPELDPPGTDDMFHPEQLQFVEPLRGFEDWTLPARAAALAELSWSYPIPIDAGWATSLYYLPASLLRTLDLQLFGSGALVAPPEGGRFAEHYAIGAALRLSMILFRAPLQLRYQVARRLTDDEAVSHQVGIALDF